MLLLELLLHRHLLLMLGDKYRGQANRARHP
jgi:hypothetical protein